MQDPNKQAKDMRSRQFRIMLTSAMLRPMGGVILAVTILIAAFVNPWFIPIGLIFYGVSVYFSLTDPSFNRKAIDDAMYPEKTLDLGRLKGRYRAIMQQALDQRKRIEQAVSSTGSDAIRSSLVSATSGVDELSDMVYEIAYKAQTLESYMSSVDIGAVRNEVATMKARLTLAPRAEATQYDDVLKLKEEQLANLSDVNTALERYQAQLAQSLSALDNIYSLVLKIKSADVRSLSDATDQVSANLHEQVSQLRNLANAYDAVMSGKV